jgi:hypothetical protein
MILLLCYSSYLFFIMIVCQTKANSSSRLTHIPISISLSFKFHILHCILSLLISSFYLTIVHNRCSIKFTGELVDSRASAFHAVDQAIGIISRDGPLEQRPTAIIGPPDSTGVRSNKILDLV